MASNSQRAIRGMSSQAIVTLVLGVLEIVSFSIMSHLLSQEDFGYYAAISAVVAVFASFSETGIGSAIVQCKNPDSTYINNAFTLSLIFGSFISVILFVSSNFLASSIIDDSMRGPLQLMSVTLLFNCLSSVNISILQRDLKFIHIGGVHLFSLIITTVVAVVLALKGFGYYAIVTKAILSSVLTFIVSFFLAHTRYRLNLNIKSFKEIFSFSGWLMASRFFSNLSKQIDRLVMPKMMSVEILGAYTRPKEFITQISGKLNGIFDTALFPVLSSIQDKRDSLVRAFSKAFYLLCLSTSILTLFFIVNSKLILRIFFGEKWLDLSSIFSILSLLVFFNAVGRLADCYLRSLGNTKAQFIFRIVEFVIKLGSIALCRPLGLYGVVVGLVVAEGMVKIVKLIYASSLIHYPFLRLLAEMWSSLRPVLLLLPIVVISFMMFPNTIYGEVFFLGFVSVATAILFVFFPKFVGGYFVHDVYPKIASRCPPRIQRIIGYKSESNN